MGYDAKFSGSFAVSPVLTAGQVHDLDLFASRRHEDNPLKIPFGSYYCEWVPSRDGTKIEWSGGEKFDHYVEWLNYLIENILKPWGCVLNGKVRYQGEEPNDRGAIIVIDNMVTQKKDQIIEA